MHIVMKKDRLTMRYLSFILFLLIGLTSCDTREDWFAKEGEGATFIIKSCKTALKDFDTDDNKYEFRNDTVYSDNSRVIEIDLRLDEIEWDDNRYSPGVTYQSELLNLDVEGLGQKVSKSQYSDKDVTTDQRESRFVQDGKGRFRFVRHRESYFPTTNNDTTKAPVLNTAHMIVRVEDVFRNEYYCHVKINWLGNMAPIPVMEMKDVDGKPMEKVFNLSKSHDKDGSVVKYEYCIDGEIRDYDLPTFDCDPAGVSAGKGAYGGTYITSTEQSEIKHAFQTKGEHIVFYRCMDNLGLWSLWAYKIVTI
jgi:hypothetical protein